MPYIPNVMSKGSIRWPSMHYADVGLLLWKAVFAPTWVFPTHKLQSGKAPGVRPAGIPA
jgi:hypothetical protein